MTSRTLAKTIAHFALEKKASDIVLMDLRGVTTTTDFFVICSADSDTQVKAIADSIVEGTVTKGITVWHSEGMQALVWVVLDYVDVVVHVFHKEARRFYNLERLWGDAKIIEIMDEIGHTAQRKRRAKEQTMAGRPGKRKAMR
ncbi:MAG TPA: ribosome silencing factor [Bacteroidota bacterium]|nr:ribosome silencing factor [Bacteroidota bacterium]